MNRSSRREHRDMFRDYAARQRPAVTPFGQRPIPQRGDTILLAWATTTSAVATTDTTFTVRDVVMFDGSAYSGDNSSSSSSSGNLTVQNSPDAYKIASGARGKIVSCISQSGTVEWHPLDFPPVC